MQEGQEGSPGDETIGPRETCARLSLFQIFKLFFRLGSVCFGGMWAAMDRLERELVDKRKIITSEEQKSLMLAAAIIPAPKFLAFAAMVGYRIHGFGGAVVALISILFPGASLVLIACVLSTQAADSALLNAVQHSVGLGVIGLLLGNAARMFFAGNHSISILIRGLFIPAGIPVFVYLVQGPLIVAACLSLICGTFILRVGEVVPND